MIPELGELTAKEGGLGALLAGAVLLGLKAYLRVRSDLRGDKGEVTAQHGFELTVQTLTKQAERQEAVIVNLSDRLQKLDDRLTVEQEARRKAVHEMLDAQQKSVTLQHRLDVAEAAAELCRSSSELLKDRVLQLEREVRILREQRPLGDTP